MREEGAGISNRREVTLPDNGRSRAAYPGGNARQPAEWRGDGREVFGG